MRFEKSQWESRERGSGSRWQVKHRRREIGGVDRGEEARVPGERA